ncbi:MAG: serine--tRNA ligase [Parcubacteria group bacterium]|nr:serine--tRNA ligase [Parcubacteria group bacterium]
MLDIRFIRENPDLVREAARKKRVDFDVNQLLEVDAKRVAVLQDVEKLRARMNVGSEAVANAPETERKHMITDLRTIKTDLAQKEERLKELNEEWRQLMFRVPNIPDPSVPDGDSDADNQEIRRWGDIPHFDFSLKNHLELMRDLDLADFERGSKVSGFRGYFLKNEGVLLSFALWRHALDYMMAKGFTSLISPALVKEESLVGTGKLPQFREELYGTDDKLYLAATAEISVMGYHMNETFTEAEFPKKYIAFSPSYRREAGSYGKDTQGIIRVHEFVKVEQVILCKAEHQESVRWHEELTRYSEEMLQALNLPYRVVINATGDLPFGQVKMYDIETWLPSEEKYRETHSSSILHDFQTRRLNIRYRDKEGALHFAHSLNNTAIATPRLLAMLLENYQQEDGSVRVPEALRQHVGVSVITPKKA